MPWMLGLAVPVAALAALAVIWRWPDKGWRWVLVAESLCALFVGLLATTTTDRAVVVILASPVGTTALVGVLGAAGWLAHSGSRALAAAVAGLAAVTHGLQYVVGLADLGNRFTDFTSLFAMAGVALLCASALLGLNVRFRGGHARLTNGVVIAAAAAASLLPLAFVVMSWVLPLPLDALEDLPARLRQEGSVALLVAAAVVAVAAWAGPRLALSALTLGALVAGAVTVSPYVVFIDINEDMSERGPGLSSTAWLLILTGLAVGIALALAPIRGHLA